MTRKFDDDCDHGWAWVVLFAVFLLQAIMTAGFLSSSIFYYFLLKEFRESHAYTSWFGALNGLNFLISVDFLSLFFKMVPVNHDYDRGWAWVVLFAIFSLNVLLSSHYCSMSIFYPHLLHTFGETRTFTSWYGSLNTIMLFTAGSLASYLLPRIGTRAVILISAALVTIAFIIVSISHSLLLTIICYGILGGTGYGLMLTGAVAAVAQYFKKHIYKASSISFVGGGVGAFIYTPLLEWLDTIYGWRGCALIFSGLAMNVFVIAMVIRPPRPEPSKKLITINNGCSMTDTQNGIKTEIELEAVTENPSRANVINGDGIQETEYPTNGIKEKEPNSINCKSADEPLNERLLTTRERFTDINFWCLAVMGFTWSFSNTTFISIFKDLCESNGTIQYFQTAMLYCGVCQVLSRILVCFLTFDKVILSLALTFLLGSGVVFSFIFATTYWPLMISSTGLGMLLGSTFLMVPMSVGAVYGRKEMAITYGYVLFCTAASSAIGPPLIGYLRDMTLSYDTSIYVLAAMELVGASVSFFLYRRSTKKTQ